MPAEAPPAPKTAAAPPPSVVTPPPTSEKAAPSKDDSFAELHELANAGEVKKNTPKPPEKSSVKAEEKPKEEVVSEELETKSEEKPTEQKPPPKAAELRVAYEKSKTEIKTLKAERDQIKSELEKVKSGALPETEKASLLESVKTANEKLAKAQEEIKFLAYERSDEYKEKFQKPYEETATNATTRATQLKVTKEDGNQRNLSDDEFWNIARIGDDYSAIQAVKELFPDDPHQAAVIMKLRDEVITAYKRGEQAKAEYRKTASEREKSELANRLQQQQTTEAQRKKNNEEFKRLNEEAIQKFPQWFKEEDGDDKGNELLKKGFALVEKAFTPPEGTTPEELIKLHSAVRNRAAGFGRMVHKVKTMETKIAELEAELSEFRASDPSAAGDTGRKAEKGALSAEDEIRALAR